MLARLVPLLRTATLAVLAVVAGLVVLGSLLGWRPVVLLSGSMAPGAPTGSLVLAEPVPGERVAVGDVITVTWPGVATPVTHRVVDIAVLDRGGLLATTKGDANDANDEPTVRLDGTSVLRARAVVPGAGAALVGDGPRLLVGSAAVLGGLLGITWVWWPSPPSGTRGRAPVHHDPSPRSA